jgi:sugar lactone lactonase YvrE
MNKSLLLIGWACLVAAAVAAPVGQKLDLPDGAAVVHNTGPGKWGKTPAVALQPVRVLGDVDSDDEAIAFHMPSGLAIDDQGRLYVLDSGNHRVQVFSPEGKYLKTIGRKGQGPGEFFMPSSIGLGPKGALFVGERQAARIQEIGPDGKLGRTIKLTEGAAGDALVLPGGGFVMAAGMGGGMVSIQVGGPQDAAPAPLLKALDVEGRTLREFGAPAVYGDFLVDRTANQVMTAPDGQGGIYAVFPYQNRIERYSPAGKLLWRADRALGYSMEIKGKGEMKSENRGGGQAVTLRMPDMSRCASGAAVDGKGRLWVATLARQLKESERVSIQASMSNDNGIVSGSQKATGAVDLRTTDAYKLEVYGPDGALLGSIPVKTFVDAIFIRGDRLFLLDKVRGVQFHEFKIIG